MIATEPTLGVSVSSRYLFFVITLPVGAFYAEGANPTRIYVEQRHVRAVHGGVGAAKTSGNYSATLLATREAERKGYTQVLWLDAKERKYVEEVGTSNIFFYVDDGLVTPPLDGTILPGVTRDSVIQIARDWGLKLTERPITIDEVLEGCSSRRVKEVFRHRDPRPSSRPSDGLPTTARRFESRMVRRVNCPRNCMKRLQGSSTDGRKIGSTGGSGLPDVASRSRL